ncbi:hypothetical protein KCU61_g184, partial [Aureobasidium melanogenum]
MAPAASGAKKQKKKWSKGKVKDKAQHAVILDKATSDRLQKEVQSYRLVTVATLVDRLKINGSLARRSLADLEEQGQIKKVVSHSKCLVYTRAAAKANPPASFVKTLFSYKLVNVCLVSRVHCALPCHFSYKAVSFHRM